MPRASEQRRPRGERGIVTGREARLHHFRVEVGVARRRRQPAPQLGVGRQLDSRGCRADDIEIVGISILGRSEREVDQVGESLVEVGGGEQHPLVQHVSIDAGLPTPGFLRLQFRIAGDEPGRVVLEEGGRLEPGSDDTSQPQPAGERHHRPAAVGGEAAERLVVFHTGSPRQRDTVADRDQSLPVERTIRSCEVRAAGGGAELAHRLVEAPLTVVVERSADGEHGVVRDMKVRTRIHAATGHLVQTAEGAVVLVVIEVVVHATVAAVRRQEEHALDPLQQKARRTQRERGALTELECVAVDKIPRAVRREVEVVVRVAHRKSEFGRIVRPQVDQRARGGIPVVVVERVGAVGRKAAHRYGVSPGARTPGEAGLQVGGAVAPRAEAAVHSRLAAAFAGEDLDDAAHGVRPVEHARGPPHHLDPLDVVRAEVRQVDGAARLIDRHAVDQHLHVIALAAAHEQRRFSPPRAALHDAEPRQAGHGIRYATNAALSELLAL